MFTMTLASAEDDKLMRPAEHYQTHNQALAAATAEIIGFSKIYPSHETEVTLANDYLPAVTQWRLFHECGSFEEGDFGRVEIDLTITGDTRCYDCHLHPGWADSKAAFDIYLGYSARYCANCKGSGRDDIDHAMMEHLQAIVPHEIG